MRNTIYVITKSLLIGFFVLAFTISAQSQSMGYIGNIDSTYIKYPKQLRDTTLMNTDHFYITLEVGVGFNLGPTVTDSPGDRFETNSAPFGLYDFSMITPTKFNLGYAFKNHHFEGSFGMMRERLNVSILDASGNRAIDYHRNQTYGTVTFRYFYRFPMQIPRLKLMMGAEIGGGYRPTSDMQEKSYTVIRDTGYTFNSSTRWNHDFQLILGISTRMDIKVCKNLTFTLLATLQGSPLKGTEYIFNYTYQGSTNQTAQAHSTLLNLNLNAGIKLDLFCHKNKRATYDRYGMDDPYRDK